MSSSSPFSELTVAPAVEAERKRAKERLYVFCQSASWLVMLIIQIWVVFAFQPYKPRNPEQLANSLCVVTIMIALGLLITHFTRHFFHRWGWRELSWRALVPRILGMAGVQALLWCGLLFGYSYLVLRGAKVPDIKTLPALAIGWFNCMMILSGWWLVYSVYHLFDRVNQMQIEQLRLAAEVKEAELRALKSQVNPHFIFNALNSLRALIDEDPTRARQAVTQLANLLRYSLQSAQAETVPFESELRVVNDYLALEQVRHEERLRLKLDIAPDTLGLAVPPLLLQTLVENAVKYGISPRPDGGEIQIVARCESGQLKLRVTNPGNLGGARAAGQQGRSTALGLKNAAERLRMSFGDAARLQLRGEKPELVVAEVSMPAQIARA